MIEHANSRIAFHAATLHAALRVAAEAGDALVRIWEESGDVIDPQIIATSEASLHIYRRDSEEAIRLASAARAMARVFGEPYDEIVDDMHGHL